MTIESSKAKIVEVIKRHYDYIKGSGVPGMNTFSSDTIGVSPDEVRKNLNVDLADSIDEMTPAMQEFNDAVSNLKARENLDEADLQFHYGAYKVVEAMSAMLEIHRATDNGARLRISEEIMEEVLHSSIYDFVDYFVNNKSSDSRDK